MIRPFLHADPILAFLHPDRVARFVPWSRVTRRVPTVRKHREPQQRSGEFRTRVPSVRLTCPFASPKQLYPMTFSDIKPLDGDLGGNSAPGVASHFKYGDQPHASSHAPWRVRSGFPQQINRKKQRTGLHSGQEDTPRASITGRDTSFGTSYTLTELRERDRVVGTRCYAIRTTFAACASVTYAAHRAIRPRRCSNRSERA